MNEQGRSFVERAYPTQLAPNRDIGVWLRGDANGGFVHYAVGVVRDFELRLVDQPSHRL